MTLRVVGAGLGRTGTMSLKLALERLLGGACYHMAEVMQHPEHVPVWHDASQGSMPDWRAFFTEYRAAVDWPAAAFWPELADAFPDAIILFSRRAPGAWWTSARRTIFQRTPSPDTEWGAMIKALFAARFTLDTRDRAAAVAAFEQHEADVLRRADPARLVVWEAGDGWAPLCAALRLPVPEAPFPHANTTEEFHRRFPTIASDAGGS